LPSETHEKSKEILSEFVRTSCCTLRRLTSGLVVWHTPFFSEYPYFFLTTFKGASKPILWYLNNLLPVGNLFKTCNLAVDLGKSLQRSSFHRHMSVKAPCNTCYSSCPTAGLSQRCVTRIQTSPPCNTCYSSCPTAGLSQSCVTRIRT